MNWRKILTDYFTFSRKDRFGILALICLILLSIYIPLLFSKPADPSKILSDSSLIKAIKLQTEDLTYKNTNPDDYPENGSYKVESASIAKFDENASLFYFDPNTLDNDGWKKLGLKDKTIRTINNYRQKGGRFYKPQDLEKIWGLPEGFYKKVESYINIPSFNQPTFSNYTPNEKINRMIIIDINEADTTAFIALPGIGSKLASRIVNFRDKLGGFYSIDQVGETFGLPDSTFQQIKDNLRLHTKETRKLNINKATKEKLKTHPYIKWQLANAIVEYRNQHGDYKKIEDLMKITLIDEITFEKIVPYLSIE